MCAMGTLIAFAGLSLAMWFSEGEFAGSAAAHLRRVHMRRVGFALVFIGIVLKAWSGGD